MNNGLNGNPLGDPAKALRDKSITNAKIADATVDLTTKVTGVLPAANGGSGGVSLVTKYKTADQTVTDSDTLVNDSHLIFTVTASAKYKITGALFCTTVSTSGIKFDFDNLSGASATNFIMRVYFDGGGSESRNSAALATDISANLGSGQSIVELNGFIEVNAGGTIGLRFAQAAETGAAESVVLLRDSWITFELVP